MSASLIAYIDGFNLYHAIDDLNRPDLKWLDLQALCVSLARPHETLVEVNYFSAYATWLPEQHKRHIEYVKALEHVGVKCIMGHFKVKPVNCKKCGKGWLHHEEKETDVHIAARIIADAYEGRFDRAILITADSDLAPAIKIVKRAFPKRQIFVVAPPERFGHARDLDPRLALTKGRLAKCPLPETAKDAAGNVIFTRPANYAPLAAPP